MKPLIGFKTCLKTLPGFLPAHFSSWRSRSPTFQTPSCLTVCLPGRLMRDGEPRPCGISSFQASKSSGPQLLHVTRCLGFHCSWAFRHAELQLSSGADKKLGTWKPCNWQFPNSKAPYSADAMNDFFLLLLLSRSQIPVKVGSFLFLIHSLTSQIWKPLTFYV